MSGRKRRLQPRRAGSDGNENLAHPSFTLNVPPTPQPSLAQDSAKQEATPSPSLSFGCFTFPDDELMLPIMPLPKVKLPTDLITLNLFEPRYRTMFKLVAQQKCR